MSDYTIVEPGTMVRVTRLMPEGREASAAQRAIGDGPVTYVRADVNDEILRHLIRTNPNDEYSTVWVHDVAPVDMPATATEEGPAMVTREEADRMVREARREARQEAVREFEDWKARATEVAHTYAEENSLCSEFDRCMVEIGLQPRDSWEREVDVTLSVTVRVTVPGGEADDESTLKAAALEQVGEAIRYGNYLDVDMTEYDDA